MNSKPLGRIWKLIAGISLGSCSIFLYFYYERYLRWTFNEEGRYYDARTQTVYTTSGLAWGILAAIAGLLGAAALYKLHRPAKAETK